MLSRRLAIAYQHDLLEEQRGEALGQNVREGDLVDQLSSLLSVIEGISDLVVEEEDGADVQEGGDPHFVEAQGAVQGYLTLGLWAEGHEVVLREEVYAVGLITQLDDFLLRAAPFGVVRPQYHDGSHAMLCPRVECIELCEPYEFFVLLVDVGDEDAALGHEAGDVRHAFRRPDLREEGRSGVAAIDELVAISHDDEAGVRQ